MLIVTGSCIKLGNTSLRHQLNLTNTSLFVKSVQNKASGTEALLYSINDCTTVRTSTVVSTGHIS